MVSALKDAGWLLLVVLMCPVVILAIGAPVALLVRLILEMVARWG